MSDKNNSSCRARYAAVGGQALMEGVMMQSPNAAALAVRKPDGTIAIEHPELKHIRDKHKVFGIPLVRGVVNFIESMLFGYKCLMRSAELSTEGALDAPPEEEMSKFDRWISDHFGPKMLGVITAVGMVLGLALSLFLFVWLPSFAVDLILGEKLLRLQPLFEGVIRIIIFIGYIAFVSLEKDIKRVFMYHGAEHKTIFCLEAGLPLTVENVRAQKRFHPRCGTNFMFVILLISILLSSAVAAAFPQLGAADMRIWWMLIKIFLLLPLVMGIGYEFIRYAGRHTNVLTRVVSAPGLAMQRLTTREPTDDIIEVGIASMNACLDKTTDEAILSMRVPVPEEEAKKTEAAKEEPGGASVATEGPAE